MYSALGRVGMLILYSPEMWNLYCIYRKPSYTKYNKIPDIRNVIYLFIDSLKWIRITHWNTNYPSNYTYPS